MKTYKPGEFALKVNRTVQTLRLWDRKGILPAQKTSSGHRYYTDEDYHKVLGMSREATSINVIYARVSSQKQKDDLERQCALLESFCVASGIQIDKVVKEIGGGLNYKRKYFLLVMKEVESGNVKTLVVAHKDRLCRFGFEFFEHFCETHGTKLIIVNQQEMSPQQELLEDLMSVIHTFSCRLYGLRKYNKQISMILEGKDPCKHDNIL